MSLKKQLLVVAALTLLIPLAGFQFVLQLEDALRGRELDQLRDQALRIARTLEQDLPARHTRPPGRTLFVETFERQLILDGYGDDWPNRPGEDGVPLLYAAGDKVRWRAAQDTDHLWLLMQFPGLKPAFGASAGSGQGQRAPSRLILSWKMPGGDLEERLIEAPAPGRALVRSYATELPWGRGAAADATIQAVWQTQTNGFTVELQRPRLPPGSQLGFSLEHAQAGKPATTFGALGRIGPGADSADQHAQLPYLLMDQPAHDALLAQFVTPGQSLTLVSNEGWQTAQAEAPLPEASVDVTLFSPFELLQQATLQGLRLLLSSQRDQGPLLAPEGARWQGLPLQQARQADHKQAVTALEATHAGAGAPALTVIVPVGSGPDRDYLISRRSTDALLSLSSTTLGQVLARSMLLTLALVLVLVGYASWLSWRISRLQRAVSSAFDSEGRITGVPDSSRAGDELGELSRHFTHLVGQVRGYTQYLESFARKLSHELKTPLAVIRSSLDNLNHTDPSPAQRIYLDRATEGGERLSRILTAMSEAARLESSLTRTEKEIFDLAAVLAMAAEGYQGMDSRVRYHGQAGPCLLLGAPDLLVQALDKLIENARDFTPTDGSIEISLEEAGRHWALGVCNDGPTLPEAMGEHIFDSFISVRQPDGDNGHLGQGLVIAKLVSEFHQGRIVAENRPQGRGVCFTLFLPRHLAGQTV